MMGQEIRKSFHEDLDEVKRSVARLTALVTDAIPRGTAVLLANDVEEAQAVIDHDEVLNELSLEIEEHCCQILALQQPVAVEFRAMVTALRLNAEVERSGDLVANIAKATRYMQGATFSPTIRGLIERMSEEAVRLNRAAIDAYLDGDAELAASIDEMDDTLDGLHRELIEALFAEHEAEALELEVAVQLALIARFYERIGDHAVTMGQRVEYMVTGWLPEHAHGEPQSVGGPPGAGGSSPPGG